MGWVREGARQACGDKECRGTDTEVDSSEDKVDTEASGAAIEVKFGVVVGVTYWGKCEEGNQVEGDWVDGMEKEQVDLKGNLDSWKTTSREIYNPRVGIW
jgi:hypothetical protein